MSDDIRFKREIAQIARLQRLLEGDQILPLRMTFERQSLDMRRSRVMFRGLTGLIGAPGVIREATASEFAINLNVPSTYPWYAIPNIQFSGRIPFHPHVWSDGRICWGTADTPQPDLMLVDWLVRIVEILQLNQASLIGINPGSPANGTALQWWQNHRQDLDRFIPPIDLARLRFWADQSKRS